MRTFSLRSRLTVVGIATVALPLVIVGFANWRAARDIAALTTTEIAKASQEHFSAEVEGIASLATLADQQLRSELDVSRRVALARLQAAGGMRIGPVDGKEPSHGREPASEAASRRVWGRLVGSSCGEGGERGALGG